MSEKGWTGAMSWTTVRQGRLVAHFWLVPQIARCEATCA